MLANKTLLSMKYSRIVYGFSKAMNIDAEDALRIFYNSDLYRQMSQGIADVHCQSDQWLIQELIEEYNEHPVQKDNKQIKKMDINFN